MSQNNPQTIPLKSTLPIQTQSNQKKQQNKSNSDKNQEDQLNYYNQFCRLYLANEVLMAQLKQLNMEKNQLFNKLNRIEKKAQEIQEGSSPQNDQKKRRLRRSAAQIARHYKCMVQSCGKSYGSQGSLNQHIKIKHPQAFKAMGNLSSNNNTVKQHSYDINDGSQ